VRILPGSLDHSAAKSPGAATRAALGALILLLPDGSRTPIIGTMTIGRGDEATIRIADQTVSRLHVRIEPGPDGPVIEDAGSRFGTLLSGVRLTGPAVLEAGATVRLGDVLIAVESAEAARQAEAGARSGSEAGPGETIVVPVDATLLGLRSPAPPASGVDGALRPRVKSGWALKRLGEEEGQDRFVLRDLRGGTFLKMDAEDAALFELLDGNRTVLELLGESERLVGPSGPGRLARLIADLADRGLLEGVKGLSSDAPQTALQRIFKPRDWTWGWVPDYFPRAYRHWGRIFFSPLAATMLALLALAGFGAFTYIVGAKYGTPFVVANKLVIGGAVFLAGRFAIVAFHELAHGLALAKYGRRAPRAGLRLVLIFPYAFVDTSEAYFEPRSHRIVISAAGPASDLTMGAVFSFACAAAGKGTTGEIFFQLAFGAYLGAFFNLNPFLDRDGYNILVDVLREPGLRQRARQQLAQRLSGRGGGEQDSPVLARYAIAGAVWSAVGAGFAVIFSAQYYHRLSKLAPHQHQLVIAAFIAFWIILFIPLVMQLGHPLLRRLRYGPAEVNRVIR
jgi:putative peptide zinc metalloprotease protein